MENNQQLMNIYNDLCTKFGIAIDWTSDNVLPYLQELSERIARHEIITSIFYMTSGLVIYIIWLVFFIISLKGEPDDDYIGLLGFLTFVATGLFIVLLIIQGSDIFQTILLPEATVLEYIRKY